MRYLLSLLVLLLGSLAYALPPHQAVTVALKDLDAQAIEDAPFLRYLYHPDPSQEFALAQRFHVNLISRQASFAFPKGIAEGLYRVDLRDYGWDRRTWEKLADIDPYFHRLVEEEIVVEVEVIVEVPYGVKDAYGKWVQTEVRKEKQIRKEKRKQVKRDLFVPLSAGQLASLALLAQSQAPLVRADWFLVQGARQIDLNNRTTGTGYYDWLGLRSRDDYFRLVGFDAARVARTQKEVFAVLSESGITSHNRLIQRLDTLWTTFDSFSEQGRSIAIQNLRKGEFLHDAEEHYAPLPNGLPAMYLSDKNGVQQDSAPDKIGGNRAALNVGNDLRIHANISCIQCHGGQVLQPIDDDVRAIYTGRLSVLSNDKGLALELQRQYGQSLNRFLQRDREDYQDLFQRVTGKPANETVRLYSEAYTRYAYGRLDIATAARELGVSSADFAKAITDGAIRLGRSDFRLDPFLATGPKRTISRLTWEDAFQDAQDLLYGVLKE